MTTVDGPRARAANRAVVQSAFRNAVRDGLARTGTRQKDVAAKVGKSPVDISRYLTTPHRLPRNWPLVEQILRAAGADVDSFLDSHGDYWGIDPSDYRDKRLHDAPPEDVPAPPTPPASEQEDATEPVCEAADSSAQTVTVEPPTVNVQPATHPVQIPAPRPPLMWPDRTRHEISQTNSYQENPLQNFGIPPVEHVDVAPAGYFRIPPPSDTAKSETRSRRVKLRTALLALAGVLGLLAQAYVVSLIVRPLSSDDPPGTAPATPPGRAATVIRDGTQLSRGPSSDPAYAADMKLNSDVTVVAQCGEKGDLVSDPAGRWSSTWLRLPDGHYLNATAIKTTGPAFIANCYPGQETVPVYPSPTK